MKRTFVLITLLCTSRLGVIAQIVAPEAYSSSIKINYVRVWDPVKPYSDDADVISSSRTPQEVRQSTQYFDGLGRPLQTVIKKGSLITGGSAVDMVSPIVYDEFGREAYKYLPFAANSTGGNSSVSDGFFKLNPFQQDSAFNKGLFSDESYYYGKTVFEASPRSLPLETYSPGNNWVGTASQSNEANRRGIKTKYWLNTIADSVQLWTVTDVSNSFGTYTSSGIYSAGKLYKTALLDEHNNQVIEFKDTEGKILLKKVQLTASADTGTGKNHTGWLCTYYIYDELNNLRCVIQPKAIEVLATSSWSLTSTLLDELCFRYEYDYRGRMIMKKVPGAGAVYIIYDARDRVVMLQDSAMRLTRKWLYTKYDGLNRPIETGLITDSTYYFNSSYHRTQAENSISYPNTGSYTHEELTRTFYDDYSWRSNEGNPLSSTRNTSYDSYLITPSNSTFPYPQSATTQSNQLNGMVTGTKTKVLGTSTYLYTVSFYDERGKVIQTQNTNHTSGTDIITTQYSWSGQIVLNINKNEKSGANTQTAVVLSQLSYDDLFRLVKTEKKISHSKVNSGSMPTGWTGISSQEYDAFGHLKKQNLHLPGAGGGDPLESLDYEYNIRGWILGMNRDYAKAGGSVKWFGYDLGYDKTNIQAPGASSIGSYTAQQYNGNITGMVWKSTGDDEVRKYDFTYDAANRLIGADFNQLQTSSGFNKSAGVDFSVSGLSYDVNGNILGMNQKGWTLSGSVTIDSLLYGYNTNSNRLNYVNDRKNDSVTILGDFKEYTNNTSQDYNYDGNGNMSSDANKRITGITYNYLNLPSEITIEYIANPPYSTRGINYTYNASGVKLEKKVTEVYYAGVNRLITTKYLGVCVYESKLTNQGGSPEPDDYTDVLQYISTEEGRARIKKDSSAIVYDYFIKDHLGNVRMVLTNENQIDAYPTASMETAQSTVENTYYSQIEETRYPKSSISNYPSDTYTDPNDYVAKLNGNGSSGNYKTGPSMALKVMAGDTINIFAKSYWKPNTGNLEPISNNGMLTELVAAMAGGFAGVSNGHYQSSNLTGGALNGGASSILSQNASVFLADQGSTGENRPKAFLNWIMFDERFNYVASSSGYDFVGVANTLKTHTFNNLVMTKNGYLFVYVSNESQLNVYFDNLQVTHMRGKLLEETHYYPFGLNMGGISSKALNRSAENKYRLNSKELQNREFSDGSGLEVYDFGARQQDPQIGRWTTIDPLAQKRCWVTPYNYVQNNPMTRIDPNGLTDYTLNKKTGEIKEVANTKTTEGPDRILKTKKDGSIKEKNGVAKVAINGIEKGILKDGINFQQKDNLIAVGGKGQATEAGVEAFALSLSNYIGKEIGGAYFSKDGATTTTHISIGKYESNKLGRVEGGYGEYLNYIDKGDDYSRYNHTGYFHTHPDGSSQTSRDRPSLDDIIARDNSLREIPSLRFYIITAPVTNQDPNPYKIEYTKWRD